MTDSFYDSRHVPSGVRAARAPAPEGGRTDGATAPDPRLELDTFLVSQEEIPLPFDFSPKVYRATIHDYGDGLCEISYRLIPEEWKNRWGSGNYQPTVRGDSDNREVNEENAVRRAKSKARKLIIAMRANHLLTLTFREKIDDLQVAWKRFEQFIRNVHERYPQWQYVAAPELQKRGSWHFHVAVKGFQDIGYLRACWLRVCGGPGKGNIDVTHSKRFARGGDSGLIAVRIAIYISKYIAKQLDYGRIFGRHRYRKSRELTIPTQKMWLAADTYWDAFDQAKGLVRFLAGISGYDWMAPDGMSGYVASWGKSRSSPPGIR
jgi:hypothetical protein